MSMDLFGDTITSPTISESSLRSVLNAGHGFVAFWQAYPPGPRKTGKQQALNKWAKLGCCDYASLIIQHLEYMKGTQQWKDGFVPMPVTHLGRQGWIDFEPQKTPEQIRDEQIEKDRQRYAKEDAQAVPCPEHLRKKK